MKLPPLAALLLALVAPLAAKPGEKFPDLTPQETTAIDAALPQDLRATPQKSRRVLVFYRTEGFVHKSIPNANYALEHMGKRTGAFTATLSDDMAQFDPATLATYDAIIFNNTTKLAFENPAHRRALLDFVAAGKGLVGIHAATDNFYKWPEGQALIGGIFHGHPWSARDTVAVKNDDPNHTLNRAFGKKGFWITEEIYQIDGPYSRAKQRVLLSLDMSRPENARPPNKIVRTDNDFPISWLKTENSGENGDSRSRGGRVFYTSLGHNKDIFEVPQILQHMLDGIQFALGDLAAESVPSAKLKTPPAPALAPDDKTTLQTQRPGNAELQLGTLASYEVGDPLAPQQAIEQYLRAATPDQRAAIETRLIALISAPATSPNAPTTAAKTVFLNWLGWIGAEKSIETLTAAAQTPGLAHAATRALAALNAHPAGKTLTTLITDANSDATRIEALNALGQRRSNPAVPDIAKLASDKNADIATAALEALANIATPDAIAALRALPRTRDNELPRTRALIAATANLLRRNPTDANRALAIDIYGKTLAAVKTLTARIETAQALVTLDPANKTLLGFPPDSDPRLGDIIACGMATSGNPAAIKTLADNFPHISLDTQRRMMAALATAPDAAALPLVNQALTSPDAAVQLAAFAAAGACGNETTVAKLTPFLSPESKELSAAAFAALTQLPDCAGKTNAALHRRLTTPGNAVPSASDSTTLQPGSQFLRILAQRQDRDIFPTALAGTQSPDADLRAAAFEALALLVRPGDLPQILPLSAAIKRPADRREWTKALYNSAATHPGAADAIALLQKQIAVTKSADRAPMIAALTMIKSPAAKTALDAMLTSPDAAMRKETIRALGNARSQTAYDLLVERITAATDPSERLLAQRGAIDTVDQLEIPVRDKVAAYRKLWKSAKTPESKDAIIAALRNINHSSATAFLQEIAPEK